VASALPAGRGVTLIPENAELTTVHAAEILDVSRPFLIRLLEEGQITHRKVGKHRRIRMEDVMAHKVGIDSDREAVLNELAAEVRELDMGYPIDPWNSRQACTISCAPFCSSVITCETRI
jgi:excisionase family DNA binding protein